MIVYEGTYNRNGPEGANVYAIESKTSPSNYSSMSLQKSFRLVQSVYGPIPPDDVYYFGFQTQRVDANPEYSLLSETVFLTIQQQDKVIGSVTAVISYPDKGSGDTSSPGTTDYPVFASSGILKSITTIRIRFNADLSRNVYFMAKRQRCCG